MWASSIPSLCVCLFPQMGRMEKNMQQTKFVDAVEPKALFKSLPLGIEASVVMGWLDPSVLLVGDKHIVVGYVADEECPPEPSQTQDGIGDVFFARSCDPFERECFTTALAVDPCFEPELTLVEDFDADFKKAWVEAASSSSEFADWVDSIYTRRSKADRDQGYYRWHAFRYWSACQQRGLYRPRRVSDFDFTENVKLDVWARLRSAGKIGNKHAILITAVNQQTLKLSDHNLATGLPQPPAAPWLCSGDHVVWLPDQEAEVEIERRAKAYMFGQVTGFVPASGKPVFYAVTDEAYGSKSSPAFDSFGSAFEWLSKLADSLTPSTSQDVVDQAYYRARTEIAQDCIDLWNKWANGEVYGQVVSTFKNHGSPDKPVWELIDSDSCWGYYDADEGLTMACAAAFEKAASLH